MRQKRAFNLSQTSDIQSRWADRLISRSIGDVKRRASATRLRGAFSLLRLVEMVA